MKKFTFTGRNPFEETKSYDEWKLYLQYIKPSDVVYDIGAHTGWMSSFFCQISHFVYAFEPLAENFQKLLQETKNYKNIKCFRVALSDRNYKSFESFRFWHGGAPQDIFYVRLNDFIAANPDPILPPNFIKIDIEGNESVIMPALEEILISARPIIYVEMHSKLKDFKFKDQGGYDWNNLKDLGYTINSFPFSGKESLWGDPINLNTDIDWNPTRNSNVNYLLLPRQ